ncbi:beta-1,4-N-acetyl- mannosaminyltransferase [Bacteroidia bacterium]|nr:beta-1,4-N-acetyl- mannosaminyltransferase [Bacteroidia bacterium]
MVYLNTVEVMGMRVLNDDLSKVPFEGKILVNTISPNSYGISTNDPKFKEALQKCDILTLDGEYFGLASIFLKGKTIKRQNGPDNFKCFMQKANEISARVFFLGSTERALALIKEKAKVSYPNVIVETYSPPFKKEFNEEDNLAMIKAINDFKPQLLCVGMTAPKQEKWAYQHYKQLDVNVTITIGQVFDWFAGTQDEPNPIWVKIHLLWFIRTIKRPEMLTTRLPMVLKFLWYLFLNILRIRKD